MIDDKGLPLLDVWTEHSVRYRVGTDVGSAAIAGYSFTCIPIDWIASDVDGRITVVPPAWAVAADLHGKNKWIELALNLKANGVGDGTVVFVVVDDERPRIEIPALDGLDTSGVGPFSDLPSVLGCRVEIGDTSFSEHIDRPAGTWCPQHDVWGLEPSGVVVNSRVTESPYNPRSRTVLVWGTTYTLSLILDLVPAADIFAMRAADVPHRGWAAMAARTPAVGGGAVLEYLLPWIARATAQGLPFYEIETNEGWGIGQYDQDARWTLSHGRPVILYTSRAMIGRGFVMRSAGPKGGSSDDNSVPADEKMRFSWDDSVARHVVLQADTALSDMIEVRVGTNRRYRVEMPLIDVTWPSVNAHTVTGSPRTNFETQRIAR